MHLLLDLLANVRSVQFDDVAGVLAVDAADQQPGQQQRQHGTAEQSDAALVVHREHLGRAGCGELLIGTSELIGD